MLEFITQQRDLLGDTLGKYTYEKKIKDETQPTKFRIDQVESKQTKLDRALDKKEHAHGLFKHAKRVSDSQLAMLHDLWGWTNICPFMAKRMRTMATATPACHAMRKTRMATTSWMSNQ